MAKILVVYCSYDYPLRAALADHLYSFRRYAPHHCYYLNLAMQSVPEYLKQIHFDLIVYHTIFLSKRWNPPRFIRILEKARALKGFDAIKIALPQDEFYDTDTISEFCNEFGIHYLFSVMPPAEWPRLYPKLDTTQTRIIKVLTGYLDEDLPRRLEHYEREIPERTIDIGYRATRNSYWLGRHGALKVKIGEIFQDAALYEGLKVDISSREQDTLFADEWFKFLLRSKYTIGVEGGASIADRDGSIRKKTEAYLARHPYGSFEEVEADCFPGIDGSAQLYALSPRHLEACATRTCQVLIEGEYDGILKAGIHYIEVKRDLSNLTEVINLIKNDTLRQEITQRAYQDVVASGQYSYRSFVKAVLDTALPAQTAPVSDKVKAPHLFYNRLAEQISWVNVALYAGLRQQVRGALGLIFPAYKAAAIVRRVRNEQL